jgi:hypothetical protein
VVHEDEPTAGPKDSGHLRDRLLMIGDGAEPECTHDGVERGVVEREFMGVCLL